MRGKKGKLIPLLTNDMESDPTEIIDIYRKRWEIELLFKQMKQNFPLKYFYGESANAIKIQDLDNPHSKSASNGHAKEFDPFLEFFGAGYHG